MLKILGNFLIIVGAVAVVLGIFFKLVGKFKWMGKLPGDILIQKGNFTFYFPLAASILLSLLLSLLLFLIFKLTGKS